MSEVIDCTIPRPARASLAEVREVSLRHQADRLCWDLGAFLRRIERERPRAADGLKAAIDALQALAAHEAARRPDRPRQGELF